MLNDAYAHSTATRVRRLIDRNNRTISVRRLLKDLGKYPDVLPEIIGKDELVRDIELLDRATSKIKGYVDQFVAHHDRKPTSEAPIYRELNGAIDLLIQLFKKYYGAIAGADFDPIVSYLEEPLSIFRFSWFEKRSEEGT